MSRLFVERCLLAVNDPMIKHHLTLVRYDVVIGQSFDLCAYALQSMTNSRKFVAVAAGVYVLPFTGLAAGVPDNPSFIPQTMTTYSDHMSFVKRLANSVIASVIRVLVRTKLLKYQCEMMRNVSRSIDDACWSVMKTTTALMLNGDGPIDFPRPLVPRMYYMSDLEIESQVVLSKRIYALRKAQSYQQTIALLLTTVDVTDEALCEDLAAEATRDASGKLYVLRIRSQNFEKKRRNTV
ncbi:unnamed protein product [Soboliphyme baturini]|uniref:glucuronosyltransferase n=1 Tax=Soboliphyme baturini TaxID=241478 RepID=A0A183IW47_9BILA|nr:unnamed protein product [Soboliphyme baturini]